MKKSPRPENIRLGMITLGCAKNTVDAEIMLGELAEAGFVLSGDPSDADLVLVNTCGFIQPARDEADEVIAGLVAERPPRTPRTGRGGKDRRRRLVAVLGCLAERDAAGLSRRHPGLSAVWGFSARGELARRVLALFSEAAAENPEPEASAKDAKAGGAGKTRGAGEAGGEKKTDGTKNAYPAADGRLGSSGPAPVYDGPRLLSTPPSYAYLRLSDGCDNRCSYCAIPLIRGAYRERPLADVAAEARVLADGGVGELVLIAQDSTRYGAAGAGAPLAGLLERLLRATTVPRLRLLYAHPAHLDDDTLSLLLTEPRLCAYLDLPLQHIDDAVLARMNRPYGRARVEALLDRIGRDRLRAVGAAKGGAKNAGPAPFTLRTTFMTGFPGETEEAFESLLAFVGEGWFTHLGVFAYSPEADTPAASFADAAPAAVARERADRLMETQQALFFERQEARLGGREDLLVDEVVPEGYAVCRSVREAPDSDPVVLLDTANARGAAASRILPGATVRARIVARDGYDLLARAEAKSKR